MMVDAGSTALLSAVIRGVHRQDVVLLSRHQQWIYMSAWMSVTPAEIFAFPSFAVSAVALKSHVADAAVLRTYSWKKE